MAKQEGAPVIDLVVVALQAVAGLLTLISAVVVYTQSGRKSR